MEIKMVWDYPEVGKRDSYLLYHEEMESLVKNIKGLKRIRFFIDILAKLSNPYEVFRECWNA